MTTTDADPTALRHRFVQHLIEAGTIRDLAWQAAFRDIPRHLFVTRFTPSGGDTQRDLTDPDQQAAALAAVYSDAVLLTQYDASGTPTSSSTECSLMAIMLEALETTEGHRVLEIGTGTGYNTALLCHRLGDANVTSIEIHPDLARTARVALAQAGYQPTVVCGDGADGVADRAPFDRIIATCGVLRVPPAWIAQTAAGGQILLNFGFGLARLTVGRDGTASGRMLGPAAFMRLRHDIDDTATTARQIVEMTRGGGTTRATPLPDPIRDDRLAPLTEVAMPGVHRVVIHLDSDVYVYADPTTGSWVRATPVSTCTADLVEHGPRPLWSELSDLADWWNGAGQPDLRRLGLTVTRDGTHILWVDAPDNHPRALDH